MIYGGQRTYLYYRNNVNVYNEDVIVLAEGLRELGVEVYGNCNYSAVANIGDC